MKIKMVQHAVGQGGLFSGELAVGKSAKRWIYDCGSNQRDALRREIKTVAHGGEVDMLFLSHLDSDHVSGIDELLSQIKVREVVLPYFDDRLLLVTVARDAASGALTGTFVDAASNIAAWFGSRGVETITFVQGYDDEGGTDGPILSFDPDGGGEGECHFKWTGLAPESITDPDKDQSSSGKIVSVRKVKPGASVEVVTPSGSLNWALIPYVYKPSAKLMRAFDQALEDIFGTPINKKEIVRNAKNIDVRNKLRDCYDALWSDHNLISMTLYSGPLKQQNGHAVFQISIHGRGYFDDEIGGWMLTGDAHLNRLRRRNRFLNFYHRVTPLTKVFMLPHHGSIENHSECVLEALSNLRVGYAAAGPNSYGHPHRDVKRAVIGRLAYFRRVTCDRRSQIDITIQTP